MLRRWMAFPLARVGLGNALRPPAPAGLLPSNITPLNTNAGTPIDFTYETHTGSFVLLYMAKDSSATVNAPEVITWDFGGGDAALLTIGVRAQGAEGSGRNIVGIACIKGAVPGSKTLRMAATASGYSQVTAVAFDLPPWWSGSVGNSGAVTSNSSLQTLSSPSFDALASDSLIVGIGGAGNGTIGPLTLSGAGGDWGDLAAGGSSNGSASGTSSRTGYKRSPGAGQAVVLTATTLASAVSNWGAAALEIRP